MSTARPSFFLCIDNDGYAASLEVRTVYRDLDDDTARAHGMVRVVDESGEDYLFPAALFVAIEVPAEAEAAFAVVA